MSNEGGQRILITASSKKNCEEEVSRGLAASQLSQLVYVSFTSSFFRVHKGALWLCRLLAAELVLIGELFQTRLTSAQHDSGKSQSFSKTLPARRWLRAWCLECALV